MCIRSMVAFLNDLVSEKGEREENCRKTIPCEHELELVVNKGGGRDQFKLALLVFERSH